MKYGLIGSTGQMGREIIEVFGKHELTLTVSEDGERIDTPPEVIVDFSSWRATPRTIELCRRHRAGLVIGTTALPNEIIGDLRGLSGKVPVVHSFNFSIGINILKMILRNFSAYLTDWDVEMTEKHHNRKKDAPSGTAILLREAAGRDMPIHSLRMGGLPGDHSLLFANDGELLELSHRAISRKVFAIGALKAAKFVIHQRPGFYSFEEVMQCERKR